LANQVKASYEDLVNGAYKTTDSNAAARCGRSLSLGVANIKTSMAVAFALCITAQNGVAGGTLGTSGLLPLLSQQPAVYAALRESLEFDDSAWAWTRFGHSYPNLSGRRLGPYEIPAAVKGTGQKLTVVLCTTARYFDNAGHELSGGARDNAVDVGETLAAVVLKPAAEPDRYPACPGD
jgi:hypothetical protein